MQVGHVREVPQAAVVVRDCVGRIADQADLCPMRLKVSSLRVALDPRHGGGCVLLACLFISTSIASGAQNMTQTDLYAKARRRAVAKYGFFVHAAVYAAVIVLLAVINFMTSPNVIWFIWPLIGWGFAVALHGMRVFLLADRNEMVDTLTERELRQSSAGKTDEDLSRKQPE